MPAVPLGLRMVATYTGPGGATAANVLHFLDAGGDFNQATMDDLAVAWADAWAASSSDQWEADQLFECSDLSVDPAPSLFADSGAPAGTDTSIPLPPASTVCVSVRAPTGGRRGRGRAYLPGVPDSGVDSAGLLLSGTVTDYLGNMTLFGTDAAGLGWLWAVYSRTDGVVRPITVVGVDGVLDTQRRRQARFA